MMQTYRHGFRRRRNVTYRAAYLHAAASSPSRSTAATAPATRVGHERRRNVDFRVLGKHLRVPHVDRAAGPIESIAGAEPRRHVVRVAHDEVAEVDQHTAAGLRRGGESPQDRLGER